MLIHKSTYLYGNMFGNELSFLFKASFMFILEIEKLAHFFIRYRGVRSSYADMKKRVIYNNSFFYRLLSHL